MQRAKDYTEHPRISDAKDIQLPDNVSFFVHSRSVSAAIRESVHESLDDYKRTVNPDLKIPENAFQKLNSDIVTQWFFLPTDKKTVDGKWQSRAQLLSEAILNVDQQESYLTPITRSIAYMYAVSAKLIAEGAQIPIPIELDRAELIEFFTYMSKKFRSMDTRDLSTSDNTVRQRFLGQILRHRSTYIKALNKSLEARNITNDTSPKPPKPQTRMQQLFGTKAAQPASEQQTPRMTTGQLRNALLG